MAAPSRPVQKLIFFLIIFLVLALSVVVLIDARLRNIDEFTRAWVVRTLGERFDSQIELDSLHVQAWPAMSVKGKGLTVRYHNHSDLPPLIHIAEFDFNTGLLGIIVPVKRIGSVILNDMVITIPPRNKEDGSGTGRVSLLRAPHVIIDKIVCNDTTILFISKKPGKDPLDFDIHDLVLSDVGVDRPFDFRGNLTNAKPKGEIATTGTFGPWNLAQPGNTPVSGTYQFSNADLDPFPGIGGKLSSVGKYHGPLDSLSVEGQTDTPDFSIDPVGRGVPLHTDFSATVNGTDGDTYLHPVRAVLGNSLIVANGSVVLERAKQGHLITLNVDAPAAHLEDLLKLAMKSEKPPLTGAIKLHTKLTVAPGKQKAIDKLVLDGDFDADDARFTSAEVRDQLASLSRHGLGKPDDSKAGSAVSDLKGHFHVEKAVVTFTHLNFSVEGAAVLLDGSYELHGGNLDFRGKLELKAALSETMTGAKSVLLKPFDPLFKKGNSGAVIPITITGTRDNLVFGISVFHKTFKKTLGSQKQQP
jgi:AsmA-like C-terminal region